VSERVNGAHCGFVLAPEEYMTGALIIKEIQVKVYFLVDNFFLVLRREFLILLVLYLGVTAGIEPATSSEYLVDNLTVSKSSVFIC
jgi:hypothetical protein